MTKLFSQPDGASPITEEQQEGLLQKWVSIQEELNQIERDNIIIGQRWLFNKRQSKADFADITFIMNLHKIMFGKVYSWAGDLRTTQSNIGVTPYLIRPNIASLKLDIQKWIANEVYPADEIAIRYHHKLVCIHPFPNGNGRLCRLMADYINEQVFNGKPFSWGADDLYEEGKARSTYMQAIYSANKHQLNDLVSFARS